MGAMALRDLVHRFVHPVLAARALGRGRPRLVTVGGERVALWRDADGIPRAVADACPHRNAPLSLGRVRADGRLACRYHGWNFDGEGRGACPSQPTLKCHARAFHVTERDGYLWLASDATRAPVPLPTFPGCQLAASFSTRFEAPVHITLDNFTEDEHFPYVHALLGWGEDDWPRVSYEAQLHADYTEATYVGPQRPSASLPLIGVRAGDLFVNHFTTRFDPLRTVYTSHWECPETRVRRPVESRTVVFMVPESEGVTMFHTFVYAKVDPRSGYARIEPLLKVLAHVIVRGEWWMDARWVKNLAHTAPTLHGLRLGRFDKTLIRNRRLLRTHYFGDAPAPGESARDLTTADAPA